MTAVADVDVAAPSTTVLTFLRGIERRSLVLIQLQCADADAGDGVLEDACKAFSTHAEQWPMACWPLRFWALLAAAPALRRSPMPGNWPAPFNSLAMIASDDRLALLLRIVAGLDEDVAAQALVIDQEQYRQALARACPRDPAGQPDATAWRSLAEAAQQQRNSRSVNCRRSGLDRCCAGSWPARSAACTDARSR
jgi:hypothetical protein